MKNTKKQIIFLLIISALLVFNAGIVNAGFGISPPAVANKNLVPGSFYEQDIYLIQGAPDQALHVTTKIDAGKISNWIKIENGNTFDIPKGTQQFPMKVSVTVPSNADLGKYKGKIIISTLPDSENKGGVQVVLGAEVNIDLDVTAIKVSNFSIQNFQIPDVAKGSPVKFVIRVKNDGNVDNGPTKVGLTFFDKYHNKQLGQQEENITEKVKSFQTKDVSVDFSNNLDVGQYWADVKIYSDDKVVVDNKIVFNVVSPSAIKNQQKLFAFPKLPTLPFWVYLLVAAILIILVLVIIIIIILRKKAKNIVEIDSKTGEIIKKVKIHENK